MTTKLNQRDNPLNSRDLLMITILVPMYVPQQHGIHAIAKSDMDSKINVAFNPYQKRLLDQACKLLNIPTRAFIRQVCIRTAAEVIGYHSGTTPPIETSTE